MCSIGNTDLITISKSPSSVLKLYDTNIRGSLLIHSILTPGILANVCMSTLLYYTGLPIDFSLFKHFPQINLLFIKHSQINLHKAQLWLHPSCTHFHRLLMTNSLPLHVLQYLSSTPCTNLMLQPSIATQWPWWPPPLLSSPTLLPAIFPSCSFIKSHLRSTKTP